MLTLALTVAAAVAGYWTARLGLGDALLSWAEDQGRNGHGWHDPRLWLAQPILAAFLAYAWTIHPRRTRANQRAWREDREASARR